MLNSDELYNRTVREANERFPLGCMCDDEGECEYCEYVLKAARRVAWMEQAADEQEQRREDAALRFDERTLYGLPIGMGAQLYELRRMFRQ